MEKAFIIQTSVNVWEDTQSYDFIPHVFSSLEKAEYAVECHFSRQMWAIHEWGVVGEVRVSPVGDTHIYKGIFFTADDREDYISYNYRIVEVEVD